MGWNVVIENIVTDVELNAAISALKTDDVDGLAATNNALAAKLNISNSTASNLLLSNISGAANAAISRQQLTDAVATINNSLTLKAALAGATFTGAVSVPDGTSNDHAVNLSQLNTKLDLSGGTVTGAISLSTAPSVGAHLTNKTYVDANLALKADITYVDSEIGGLLDVGQPIRVALDAKAPLASPTFSGLVQSTANIGANDNSSILATTQWVQNEFSTKLPTKADLNAPALTGAPTLVTAPASDDNSSKIPTTAWVNAAIAAALGA
jgi:hypothetical protein